MPIGGPRDKFFYPMFTLIIEFFLLSMTSLLSVLRLLTLGLLSQAPITGGVIKLCVFLSLLSSYAITRSPIHLFHRIKSILCYEEDCYSMAFMFTFDIPEIVSPGT